LKAQRLRDSRELMARPFNSITQDSGLSSLSLKVSKIEAMISSMMPTHHAKDQNGWCCRFGATILSLLFSDDDIIKCTIGRKNGSCCCVGAALLSLLFSDFVLF